MALNRHPYGNLLKELLLPFIRKNYEWIKVEGIESGKLFEQDRSYSVHTMNEYTLPSYVSISIKKIKNRKDGTFISFDHKSKTITKKVGVTLFGNQLVKFDKYYISAGNRQRLLLYTRDHVRFVRKSLESNA